MGWKTNSAKSTYTYPLDDESIFVGYRYLIKNLRFNSSWDWLMPVVKALLVGEAEQEDDTIKTIISEIYDGLACQDISHVYNAVVNLIKYNKGL